MSLDITQMVITIVCSILASSGFWAYLQKLHDKNNYERDLLIGLGHDRIMYLGSQYIKRGYVTRSEFENLYKFLYTPYAKNGGNGSAEHMMNAVKQLPLKED